MKSFRLLSSAGMLALCAATSVHADIAPQDAWANFKDRLNLANGLTLTVGSETTSGGVLTVSGVTISADDVTGATFSVTIPELVFADNGDGTVTGTQSPDIAIAITGGDNQSPMSGNVRLGDFTSVYSGTPEAMTVATTGSKVTVSFSDPGQGEGSAKVDVLLNVNDLRSTQTTEKGAMEHAVFEGAAASVDLLIAGVADGEGFNVTGQFADWSAKGETSLPEGYQQMQDNALLAAGAEVRLETIGGGGTLLMAGTDASGVATNITVTLAASSSRLDLSGQAITLGGSATGMQISAMTPTVPFPVAVSIGEYATSFTMPLGASDQPQPFGMAINITDLMLDDSIWAMFDPMGGLPHDPLTARVDVSGTAKVLFDLAEADTSDMDATPFELYSATLNDLYLRALGAEISGKGDFTFDPADTNTFPGMPRPAGKADFALNGVNGLFDKLSAMGFVPDEQLMSMRMMMGMFTTVVGDDQMTSTVEITDDGGVMVNGQRFR